MSGGLNVASLSAHWGFVPSVEGAGRSYGMSAGLWHFRSSETIEMDAVADPTTHIVTPFLTGSVSHELFLDGRRRYAAPIRPGAFNLVRGGETPRALMHDSDYECLLIFLPDAVLREYVAADREGDDEGFELLPVGAEVDRGIDATARALLSEMRSSGPGGALMLDGLTLQLAAHLIRRWSNLAEDARLARARAVGGLAPWQLKRACDAIEAHLEHDVRLEELAGVVGLSAAHFSRSFKQSTGVAPFAWLLLRRVARAKDLLADPRLPLSEIAFAVGFAAQPQFTTAFKRATGMTPGAWRRERLR